MDNIMIMIELICFIIYIIIGILINWKYNKDIINKIKEVFPILSKILIPGLIILWPAIIASKIENHFCK